MERADSQSTLLVRNVFKGAGSYRASISIDGSKVGVVWKDQEISAQVEPGVHTVRARIAFQFSRPLELQFPPGGEVCLEVEMVGRPSLRQFLRLLLRPASSVWLHAPNPGGVSSDPVQHITHTGASRLRG